MIRAHVRLPIDWTVTRGQPVKHVTDHRRSWGNRCTGTKPKRLGLLALICYCFRYRILSHTKSWAGLPNILGESAVCVRNRDVPSYLSGVDQLPNCLGAQPQSLQVPHIPAFNTRIAQPVQFAPANRRFE